MLLVADTSQIGCAEHFEIQNPREIIQISQQLLRIECRDSAWHTRAGLEIAILQQLIQQERRWLNKSNERGAECGAERGAKRHLHELINDTMTCLLSLEFAVAAHPSV